MAASYDHDVLCPCERCRWDREQDADDRAIARAEEFDTDPEEPTC